VHEVSAVAPSTREFLNLLVDREVVSGHGTSWRADAKVAETMLL
jgi:hypothetical protein